MESFVNRNQDNRVTNAKEMIYAAMSNGGPKNSAMCVVEINKETTQLTLHSKKVPGISTFHSILLSDAGSTYFEYFEMGKGKFLDFKGKFIAEAQKF